jgi:hypothetical protein
MFQIKFLEKIVSNNFFPPKWSILPNNVEKGSEAREEADGDMAMRLTLDW